ncbi:hypothetical protein BGW36DRAFT_109809 [Talaromyces proteolyticus]|uniref:DUF7025 domain-containing protein n=1 Tax=Talaromyces proteolyticus TaxID=1131652 RepID=A0AAD4L0R7_9EURO|nr:uncharacterized protein BGW36DRAFT_109809 [Talaromyces proteolyticus]KAH8702011.1 hypothetical protein BGW36DRAFT_109809 [Talaromyces proteolyticus]
MASSARTKSSKRKLTHSKFHKPPKHLRRGSYRADDSFEPLIIHRVICDCEGYHYDHQSHADYFDIPQLFEGDSKASALRGESPIENTDEYFEQYKDVVLALFKVYSCNAYHDAVEHKFEMLRAPKNPDVEALERYFYRLNEDCDSRTPQWEELVIVSEDLQNEIKEVTGLFVERVLTQRQSTEMDAIVNGLYNYSRRIKRAGDEVNGRSREHIANFIRWVEIVFRNEYEEADDLFVAGRVAISHLPKLFGPDEIIVTTQGDQPQAYVVAEYPEQNDDTLEIPCYTWSFNGRFWRKHTNLVVKWPFSEDEVSIYDLSTYPLRFDESMRQRLLDRGKTFWQYRERRFVSYSPANSPFEFQTVSTTSSTCSRLYDLIYT